MGRLCSWTSYSGAVLITLSQLFLTSPLYRLICPVMLTPESSRTGEYFAIIMNKKNSKMTEIFMVKHSPCLPEHNHAVPDDVTNLMRIFDI